MVRAFDVFASLAVLILLTGGFVHRFGKVYLDVGSVDTAAMVALALLAWIPAQRVRESFILRGMQRLFDSERAEKHTRWFFGISFALLFAARIARHWSLDTLGYDLSFVHQALFFPLRGPLLPADISQSGTALGEHLLFSLLPLTLLTSWIHVDELLFLVQTLAISLPIGFILFRGPLRDRRGIALWLALVLVLSNRSLRNALIFDFREDSFGLLGFTIALVALHAGRIWTYGFGLCLALLSKESMPMIAPFLAFPILWSRSLIFSKRTRILLAGITILISLAYLILAFKVLMPFFNPNVGTASPLATRFRDFGATPTEILFNVLTRPENWLKVVSNIFDRYACLYLLMLLGPRFMTFLSREALLWFLPGLALFSLNVLSGFRNQMAMVFHYDLAGLPFLVWGTLIGLQAKILPWLDTLTPELRLKRSALLLLLALCFSEKWPMFHLTFHFPTIEQTRAHIALLRLDPEIPVLSNSMLSAQVNAHRKLLVRDEACTQARAHELQKYSGYRIIDHRKAPESDCPAPNFPPLFQNSEISIYRYSLENSPR